MADKKILHGLIDMLNEEDTETIFKILVKFAPVENKELKQLLLTVADMQKDIDEIQGKVDDLKEEVS